MTKRTYSPLENLKIIEDFLKKRPHSAFEQKNLSHDLRHIFNRLSSGQYREAYFIDRGTFDSGARTEEFFHYLAGYMKQAEKWADILKPLLYRYSPPTILDLCPGWAPKIELALLRLRYPGKVYIFDQDEASIQKLFSFINFFAPPYTLKQMRGSFFSTQPKKQNTLVLANHILDDLLIWKAAKRMQTPLQTLYESEKSFISATEYVMNNYNGNFPELFYTQLNKFIKPRGAFVLVHYEGLTETTLKLTRWMIFCKQIARKVKRTFLKHGYQNISGIGIKSIDKIEIMAMEKP